MILKLQQSFKLSGKYHYDDEMKIFGLHKHVLSEKILNTFPGDPKANIS